MRCGSTSKPVTRAAPKLWIGERPSAQNPTSRTLTFNVDALEHFIDFFPGEKTIAPHPLKCDVKFSLYCPAVLARAFSPPIEFRSLHKENRTVVPD